MQTIDCTFLKNTESFTNLFLELTNEQVREHKELPEALFLARALQHRLKIRLNHLSLVLAKRNVCMIKGIISDIGGNLNFGNSSMRVSPNNKMN